MILLIDDIRNFNVDIIARTYTAGIILLDQLDIEELYLDHDLGEFFTGLDILKFAKSHNCLPPKIQLITMNPAGHTNMVAFLLAENYKQIGNQFTK